MTTGEKIAKLRKENNYTEEQLADIFTKPLDEKRFSKLRCELNILESSNVL